MHGAGRSYLFGFGRGDGNVCVCGGEDGVRYKFLDSLCGDREKFLLRDGKARVMLAAELQSWRKRSCHYMGSGV